MCKLFRSATSSCRLVKPNGRVTSLSTTCINTSDLLPHLASSLTHFLLSFTLWFVQLLGRFSPSHLWQRGWIFWANCKVKFQDCCRGLTSVDQTLWLIIWLIFMGKFVFGRPYRLAQKLRNSEHFDLCWPQVCLTTEVDFSWPSLTIVLWTVLTAIWPAKETEFDFFWPSFRGEVFLLHWPSLNF